MVRLSIKQLMTERTRFWLGTAGISAAVALIISMQAIFAGINEQLTTFIKHAGGDLIVAQEGVHNLYLAHSVLPTDTFDQVRKVEGVDEVVPVLLLPATLKFGDATASNWLVGIPDTGTGTLAAPWSIKEGRNRPAGNQVVLDATLARKYNVKVDDTVELADKSFTVIGLSRDTSRLGSVMTFASITEARSLFGLPSDQTSYLFIRTKPGVSVNEVLNAVQKAASGTTVMTSRELMANDIKLSSDMGGDSIYAMTVVALFVGLLAVGVTVFATVSERLRDYAVLKMVGARSSMLFVMVLVQALLLATAGYVVGSIFVSLIAPIISKLPLPLPLLMVVQVNDVLWNFPMCVLVGVGSALFPWLKVYKAEPTSVFQ